MYYVGEANIIGSTKLGEEYTTIDVALIAAERRSTMHVAGTLVTEPFFVWEYDPKEGPNVRAVARNGVATWMMPCPNIGPQSPKAGHDCGKCHGTWFTLDPRGSR